MICLAHDVTGRRLAGKDVSSRRGGRASVFDQRQILVNNVQDVEQLPLVRVDPLHLNIKERVRVHFDAQVVVNEAGQSLLI